jgi:uncharacterized protein
LRHELLDRCLLALSGVARRYANLVIFSAVLLCGLSLGISWKYLDFQTDRDDLISSNDALFETQDRFLKEFPQSDDVVVMVEGGEVERRRAFVDLLAQLLRAEPDHFHAIFPKIELPFLTKLALKFLSEEELDELVLAVENAQPFLKTLDSEQGLESLFRRFERNKTAEEQTSLAPMLPFLNGVFQELERSVDSRGRSDYKSPWGQVLFSADSQELAQATHTDPNDTSFYHTVDEGRTHLLLLRLVKVDAETIALLRKTVDAAGKTFPELAVGITGEPLLEYDEMMSSERDSHQSAVLSLILVGLLFSVAFRQVARPLAAILCLALAVGWTVGFTTLVIGHLNLLTITFATILIGLGIDFGIHLLFRYEEEFRKCGKTEPALDAALLATGSDIVVGALSTATAFWAVGFTDFKGVSEIGIIAGTGVIFCLVSTLAILPALIYKMDRNRVYEPGDAIPLGSRILLAQTEARLLRRARWVLAGTVIFIVGGWSAVASVGFDYNLLRLQDQTLQSVQSELSLIKKGGNTVLFSVALADDLESARAKKALFEKLPAVARVDVISDLFPLSTPRKVEALQRLRALVKDIDTGGNPDSEGPSFSGTKLRQMGAGFESLNSLFESEKPALLSHRDRQVRDAALRFQVQMEGLFDKLSRLGPGPIEDSLGSFQEAFFRDLRQMVAFLQVQDPDYELTYDDLPENLRIRSVGKTGKLVLRIYPKKNIWEREPLQEFVTQVRGADSTSIGAPVMILHHTSILKGAFETSGLYALAAVTLILLVYFRSVRWTLLALFPLALGVFFMLYVMARYGVHFNPANFMGLPLLLGIGLDFGIHVLHRVKEEGRANMFDHSTGPATAVSGLTTICGFGTLALGGHQGVASLGLILASGVAGILFAALVVLPAVMTVFWKGEVSNESTAEVLNTTGSLDSMIA